MVRGIYSTALCKLLSDKGYKISMPTYAQRDRFENWVMEPPELEIVDTPDKHAIKIIGRLEPINEFLNALREEVPSAIILGDLRRLKNGSDTYMLHVSFSLDAKDELDSLRRKVKYTVPKHHFCRAGGESLSMMVSLVEKIVEDGLAPSDVVSKMFEDFISKLSPRLGSSFKILHSKLNGRNILIGPGVVCWRKEGAARIERRIMSSGVYDGLNVQKSPGDYAITDLKAGSSYMVTRYYSIDGKLKGEYYNICTPIELYDTYARYIDLGIDVVKAHGKEPSIIDIEELEDAVNSGKVPEVVGKRAKEVAEQILKQIS